MDELLRQIRGTIIDICREELSKHRLRSKAHPDPWSAIQRVISDIPPEIGNQEVCKPADSLASFLLKNAATRFVDNMAEAERQKDQAALQRVIEKRLTETHAACALLTLAAGNASLPWNRVDGSFQQEDGTKSVRVAVL
jgi:hypothetical protein